MTSQDSNQLGNYRIVGRLRDWSQGAVYRAVCTASDIPGIACNEMVVLMTTEGAATAGDDARVAAIADLKHAGIASVIDSFFCERDGKQIRCLVTEFVQGQVLEQLIRSSRGGIGWGKTRDIILTCIDALIYARDRGLSHGGLNPSAVFVADDGSVKLTGFAVDCNAAAVKAVENRGSDYGAYVAPELRKGKPEQCDELTDMFGLGMIFYKCLTGERAFVQSADGRTDTGKRPSFSHGAFKVLNASCRTLVMKQLTSDRSVRIPSFERMRELMESVRQRTVEATGRYELVEYLGKGGFGEVYRATDMDSGATVAVKYLYSNHQPERFLREARLMKKSDNDTLVRYIDFTEREDISGDNRYFLIMEYLEGMPDWGLKDRIKKEHGIGLEESLTLFSRYLDGLQYLHEKGVIHRDIKPGNLYAPVGNPENARIFDMGIARDISGTVTTGHVPGTLDYMPPEFALSDKDRGSARSDIYSTGLSLYEAVTGRTAYARLPKSDHKALMEFVDRAAGRKELAVDFERSPFDRCPELAPVIAKAIARNPAKRYSSAKQMKKAIDRIREKLTPGSVKEPERKPEPEPVPAGEKPGKGPLRQTPEARVKPKGSDNGRKRRKTRMDSRERRMPSGSVGDDVPDSRYGLLSLLLFVTAVLALAAVLIWGAQELPLRRAREKMRTTLRLLDAPKPSKTYVLQVKQGVTAANIWMMKDASRMDAWRGWRGELESLLEEVPALFSTEFDEAVKSRDRSKARLLMSEWEHMGSQVADMGLTDSQYGMLLLSMQGEVRGLDLSVSIASLENRIPVSLSESEFARAEEIAVAYAELLDSADQMGSEKCMAHLKEVAGRLVAIAEDYVKRTRESGEMWYGRGKQENGDRKRAELRAMSEAAPIVSAMVKKSRGAALASLDAMAEASSETMP